MRFPFGFFLVVSLCVAWPVVAADGPLVVELWPGTAPEETGDIGAEKTRMSPKLDRKQVEVTEPTRLVTNVTKPTITIYRPAKDKDTATAVLICPGGGYWDLYWQGRRQNLWVENGLAGTPHQKGGRFQGIPGQMNDDGNRREFPRISHSDGPPLGRRYVGHPLYRPRESTRKCGRHIFGLGRPQETLEIRGFGRFSCKTHPRIL